MIYGNVDHVRLEIRIRASLQRCPPVARLIDPLGAEVRFSVSQKPTRIHRNLEGSEHPATKSMPISVVMPALEMAQETGKLIAWLKKEGQIVSKGEPLLEIETDKAIMEIESPGDGVLGGIKAQAGAEIPVGQTIAWILRPGESVPLDQPVSQSGRHKEHPSSQAV